MYTATYYRTISMQLLKANATANGIDPDQDREEIISEILRTYQNLEPRETKNWIDIDGWELKPELQKNFGLTLERRASLRSAVKV